MAYVFEAEMGQVEIQIQLYTFGLQQITKKPTKACLPFH